MKKTFTLLLAIATSIGTILASYSSVDGIWYNFNNNTLTAEVTYYYSYINEYSGSVIIPSSVTYNNKTYNVTSIGSEAFRGCSGLTSVTIPNSVTSIGSEAFRGCSGLNSVYINDLAVWCAISFSSSSANPLYYAHKLYLNGVLVTDLVIPNNVTRIRNSAFSGCSGLTSVTIPNGITSIGYEAFSGCSGLTSVTIPNSVTSIGEGAFSYCTGLTSVEIPNSVTSIGSDAFEGCSSLTSVHISDIAAWCAISFESYDANPLYYAHKLYLNEVLVTNLVIPDNVTSIKSYAFANCSGLTSVTIPNGITSIGYYAFSGCSGLTSVTIPSSVTSIGSEAFCCCSGLTSVTIPNSVTNIGYDTFSGCSSLTSMTIPNSVTSIGDNAFQYCSSLTSVTIPNSVTSIGSGTFSGCSGLTSIEIPNSVTSIGGVYEYNGYKIKEGAFSGCTALTSVIIGNNVTSIGYDAFNNCSRISSVVWNAINYSDFSSYSNSPFYSSRSQITSFTFGDAVKHIPSYLCFGMAKLTAVTIPNSVTSIGSYAFYECSGLTSVTIPSSVTSIGSSAFRGCTQLTTLSLGENITSYGENAFAGCTALSSIYNYRERPARLGTGNFTDVDYFICTLYVLAGSVDMYKHISSDWKDFYYIEPIGSKSVTTEDVQVTPTDNTATVTWPIVEGATTYELVIKDKSGNVICTLVFNANGQLTSIAFNAPARDNAPQQAQSPGFEFTVTGLEEGKSYDLTMTSKDSNGTTLDQTTISFTTGSEQGIEDVHGDNLPSTKIIRDGNVYILRGEKVYSLQGQEVR